MICTSYNEKNYAMNDKMICIFSCVYLFIPFFCSLGRSLIFMPANIHCQCYFSFHVHLLIFLFVFCSSLYVHNVITYIFLFCDIFSSLSLFSVSLVVFFFSYKLNNVCVCDKNPFILHYTCIRACRESTEIVHKPENKRHLHNRKKQKKTIKNNNNQGQASTSIHIHTFLIQSTVKLAEIGLFLCEFETKTNCSFKIHTKWKNTEFYVHTQNEYALILVSREFFVRFTFAFNIFFLLDIFLLLSFLFLCGVLTAYFISCLFRFRLAIPRAKLVICSWSLLLLILMQHLVMQLYAEDRLNRFRMVNVFLLMMMMRFFLNLDKDNFSSRIYAKTHFLYEITGNNKAHRFFSCLDVCLFICCSNIVDVNVKLNKMKIEKITMAKCVENRQREKILCRFLCLMRLIYKRFNSSRKQTK